MSGRICLTSHPTHLPSPRRQEAGGGGGGGGGACLWEREDVLEGKKMFLEDSNIFMNRGVCP